MAPNHDWKDDAEFLRYNPQPRWPAFHPWLALVGGLVLGALSWITLFKQLGLIP